MLKALLGKAREATGRRPIEVGWAIQADKTSVIWDEPRAYLRKMPRPASPKSVQMCPAAIDFDARNFVVDCPVDMHLRMKMEDEKGPQIINAAGAQSNVRPKHLGQMVSLVARNEWRHPERPIRIVETEIKPETQTYIDSISGVTNYVNRTFSLFDRAKKRRPERLVFPKPSRAPESGAN